MFIPAFGCPTNIEGSSKSSALPVLLDGYAVVQLPRSLHQESWARASIPAVILGAGVADEPRDHREALGCGTDKAGSREFSGTPNGAGADGHHVVAGLHREILAWRPRSRESGEVVITDPSTSVALIAIASAICGGDGQRSPAAGRGLPRSGASRGASRRSSWPERGILPGTFFAHLFKDYDHIVRQYQVMQEELGSIRLRIIKALRFDDATFQEVLALLGQYLGQDTRIDVEFVDRIEMVHTGKHQGSISRLTMDLQDASKRAPRSQESG
jgi:phenylacetate-CoA ligase